MGGFKLWKLEWKEIFKNKMMLLSIIAICFIPLMYCGTFLWAFWDPYSKLDELPVAIVNLDEDYEEDGTTITLGNDLVKELKDSHSFHWKEMSLQEVNKKEKNHEIYFTVILPKDMSKQSVGIVKGEKQHVELTYIANGGWNYLSSKFGDSGLQKIKETLGNELSQSYLTVINDGIVEIGDHLVDASEGAKKLYDGTIALKDGTSDLEKGLVTYDEKFRQYQKGVNELANGTAELVNGMEKATQAGTALKKGSESLLTGSTQLVEGLQKSTEAVEKLKGGADSLVVNSEKLKNGMNEATNGFKTLQQGQKSQNELAIETITQWEALKNSIEQLQQSISSLPAEEQAELASDLENVFKQNEIVGAMVQKEKAVSDEIVKSSVPLGEGLQQLADGQTALYDGTKAIQNGIYTFAAGTEKMMSGASSLQAGYETLVTSMDSLQTGMISLQQGSGKLQAGMNTVKKASGDFAQANTELVKGAQKLFNGANQVTEGQNELANELANGALKVKENALTNGTLERLANPVEITKQELHEVENYGTGFAPYFISLGLCVGALLLTIVFPLSSVIGEPRNARSYYWSKMGIMIAVGTMQGIVLGAFLLSVLRLNVVHVIPFFIILILSSCVFMALVQFLVMNFRDVGRFISIALLILQLVSCGGSYPIETVPTMLQYMSSFLPMTYTVAALKSVISLGESSFLWSNVFVLLSMFIFIHLGSFIVTKIQWKKRRFQLT